MGQFPERFSPETAGGWPLIPWKGFLLNTQKPRSATAAVRSPHSLVSSELEEDCEAVLWACAREGGGSVSAGAWT